MRYRINGKFVKFKEFIKFHGLDVVNYNNLNTTEKKIWNGVKNYEEKLFIGSKFAPEKILKNPIVNQMAEFNNMPVREFVKTHKKVLVEYFQNDRIPTWSKNSFNVQNFIKAHKGKLFFKGEEISKNDLLFKISEIELEAKALPKKGKSDFVQIYNFDAEAMSNNLNLVGYESTGRSGNSNRWLSGRGKETINKKNKKKK